MAVIVVNFYGGINAPSSLFIGDANGNGSDGADRFTKTISGTATHDIAFDPLVVNPGDAITFNFESGFVGVAASYAWTVTTIDNGAGLVASISSSSATTVDFSTIFTIAGGAGSGMAGVFTITLAITNSAGTTSLAKNFMLIVP
jgi:hypothetical protein